MRIKEKRMKSFVSRANVLTQAKKQAEAAKAVSDGLHNHEPGGRGNSLGKWQENQAAGRE